MVKSNKNKQRKGKAPNAKKSQTQQRRRGQGTPAQQRDQRRGSLLLASSMVNPFAASACVPDGATGVGCFSIKTSFTMATGAGGSCWALAINADPSAAYYGSNNGTGSTPVFNLASTWNQASALATVNAQYSAIRPVSMGLRCSYIGPTQTDGGTLILAQFDKDLPLSTMDGNALNILQGYAMNYKLLPVRLGGKLFWKPTNEEDVGEWFPTTASTTTLNLATELPYLLVAAYGVTSSQSSMAVEVIYNFEGKFRQQSFISGGINNTSASKPAEVGWYETAKNVVNKYDQFVPLATNLLSGNVVGTVGSVAQLANGLMSPGILGKSFLGGG